MSSIETTGSRPVHRAEVDGVPVFWVDTGARLRADLVFGVGHVDETFLVTGVTHLVEHMTMHQLGEHPHASNARVDSCTTAFSVSSSPAVVAEHLRRVCLALAEPDPAPLEVERRVIGVEMHNGGIPPLVWWPYAARYGARGPGLIGNRELAPHLLGADEVLAWTRRWFHRGNAALVLNGPPPADLALPLPDGAPPHRGAHTPLPLPTPAWCKGPFHDAVVASMRGTWSAELATGLAVLVDRLTRRLRHEAGLVYGVELDRTDLADGTTLVALSAEAPEPHLPAVAEGVLDTLDDLCRSGPTGAELDHDRESLREACDDPDAWLEEAMQAAVERVAGVPDTAGEAARVLAGLRPDAVAAALREVRGSLVVGLPEGQRLDRLPALPACPTPPVTGRVLARALLGSHEDRGARLVLGADGITVHPDRTAEPLTVLFDDVIGVGTAPGPTGRQDDETLFVSAGAGDVVVLRARNWRGGEAAVAALRAAVPAELFYRVPEEIGG